MFHGHSTYQMKRYLKWWAKKRNLISAPRNRQKDMVGTCLITQLLKHERSWKEGSKPRPLNDSATGLLKMDDITVDELNNKAQDTKTEQHGVSEMNNLSANRTPRKPSISANIIRIYHASNVKHI